MWDVSARALGVPVSRMLGGPVRDRVRAYANGWYSGAREPEDFAKAGRRDRRPGLPRAEVGPVRGADLTVGTVGTADLRRMLEPVEAVRAAVGDDVDLFIEGHGRFDVPTAIRVGRELERFHPVFFEEPTPPDGIDALVEVRSKIRCPSPPGERWFGRTPSCRCSSGTRSTTCSPT